MTEILNTISILIIPTLIAVILVFGLVKKIDCYASFTDGAKEGFNVAIKIIPYLVSMLVAIGVFRASGVLDYIVFAIKHIINVVGVDNTFADALPVAFMKPLSGSGARAMMIETMQNYGANSFSAFVASAIQGSTETTFYVLSVYFGSITIKKFRYAILTGILADIIGIVLAIWVARLFFLANIV